MLFYIALQNACSQARFAKGRVYQFCVEGCAPYSSIRNRAFVFPKLFPGQVQASLASTQASWHAVSIRNASFGLQLSDGSFSLCSTVGSVQLSDCMLSFSVPASPRSAALWESVHNVTVLSCRLLLEINSNAETALFALTIRSSTSLISATQIKFASKASGAVYLIANLGSSKVKLQNTRYEGTIEAPRVEWAGPLIGILEDSARYCVVGLTVDVLNKNCGPQEEGLATTTFAGCARVYQQTLSVTGVVEAAEQVYVFDEAKENANVYFNETEITTTKRFSTFRGQSVFRRLKISGYIPRLDSVMASAAIGLDHDQQLRLSCVSITVQANCSAIEFSLVSHQLAAGLQIRQLSVDGAQIRTDNGWVGLFRTISGKVDIAYLTVSECSFAARSVTVLGSQMRAADASTIDNVMIDQIKTDAILIAPLLLNVSGPGDASVLASNFFVAVDLPVENASVYALGYDISGITLEAINARIVLTNRARMHSLLLTRSATAAAMLLQNIYVNASCSELLELTGVQAASLQRFEVVNITMDLQTSIQELPLIANALSAAAMQVENVSLTKRSDGLRVNTLLGSVRDATNFKVHNVSLSGAAVLLSAADCTIAATLLKIEAVAFKANYTFAALVSNLARCGLDVDGIVIREVNCAGTNFSVIQTQTEGATVIRNMEITNTKFTASECASAIGEVTAGSLSVSDSTIDSAYLAGQRVALLLIAGTQGCSLEFVGFKTVNSVMLVGENAVESGGLFGRLEAKKLRLDNNAIQFAMLPPRAAVLASQVLVIEQCLISGTTLTNEDNYPARCFYTVEQFGGPRECARLDALCPGASVTGCQADCEQ